VRVLWIVLAVAAALTLQSTLARFAGAAAGAVDLVVVVVVAASLLGGPVTGMLTGSGAGIVQDALSGGVVGIGGLAKATVGFLGGVVAQQFDVSAWLPRLVLLFVATLVHAVLFMGAYALLDLRAFPSPIASAAIEGLGNVAAGAALFGIVEGVPRVAARRRFDRRTRL
jgi:rod shape-determining protein MreD